MADHRLQQVVAFLALLLALSVVVAADSGDGWWDDAWPYRVPVQVSGAGVAEATIDFTLLFSALGLNGALLDLRSIRVVPSTGGIAGPAVPYQETYSTMLEDAESPQIGWASSGVYWRVNGGGVAVADSTRYSQGSGSLKATVDDTGIYGYPGVELLIASGLTDWSAYETFIYDVWPEVNQSALDQAPDLYWFKLYGAGCSGEDVTQGGPGLALDQWNRASVSLKPLHTCTSPTLTSITRMEFHARNNSTVSGNSGLWDVGDQMILWFDNIRLVDQDGGGSIRWQAAVGIDRYYVYFDVLEHEGHPLPTLTNLGTTTVTGTPGSAEAGGYLHLVTGANTGSLAVWSAPPVEKVLRTVVAPVAAAPLQIRAAKDEFEPFQLVVRAPSAQTLAVSIGDFAGAGGTIPASAVSLHRVDYVTLSQLSDDFGRLGAWPDPLYPVALGSNVSFPASQNQPLWFTVHVPRAAAAGSYSATVTIGAASVPIVLEVWDFALPQQIHLASEWGFGWSSVVEAYGGTNGGVQPCYWDVVDAFYEDFADHRLTPKGVGWPAGLNAPDGVTYDCPSGVLYPDDDGDWDFHTLAWKYLSGNQLDNGSGFPSFTIRGPASNWPPDSRPSSFCGAPRGADPPGDSSYNSHWFQYLSEVSDYVGATADYAAKGYYHIVNEPQTFDDYDIVAYLAQQTKDAAPNIRIMVSEQVEPLIYDNPTYSEAEIDIWMPTISNYQVERAHDRQLNYGEEVWWYFLYGDRPPQPNPTIIDRPGIEARITPWLAWLERVDGLLYYSITDWSTDPWSEPWFNAANGDGFMLYPPLAGTGVASDPCVSFSNRLVPSIRWELLRDGMEDYEYLWLLNRGAPEIGKTSQADALARGFISSRTLFSRVPTDLAAARAAVAAAMAEVFADGFESGDTSRWSVISIK